MRKLLGFLVLGLLISGCGGAGGSNPPPPPPPVSVSVSPASANVPTGGTQQFTATVQNASNTAVTWFVNDVQGGGPAMGTITTGGLYTAPASAPSGTVTVKATSNADPTKSGLAAVTVTEPPGVSISPTTADVVFGSTKNFTLKISGNPPPTVSCVVVGVGVGTCAVSGNTLTYTIPNIQPGGYQAVITVSAISSIGPPATATATANLVPSISSLVIQGSSGDDTLSCNPAGCTGVLNISGTGFFQGEILNDPWLGNKVLPAGINPTQIPPLAMSIGRSFNDPAFHQYSVSTPPGAPGGGTSNVANMAYLGFLFNTLKCSSTECFQLDQMSGMMNVFSRTNGTKLRSFLVGAANDFAVDDVTGIIVATYDSGAVSTVNSDGTPAPISGFTNTSWAMGVAAGGGYACFSRPINGDIGVFPLNQGLVTTFATKVVGDIPWGVAMATVNGQPSCVVLTVGDNRVSAVPILQPQMQPVTSMVLSGLTPARQLFGTPNGGWPVAVFQSGSQAGRLAVLSVADRLIKVVNLGAMTEIGNIPIPPTFFVGTPTVQIPARPFMIAADEADGTLRLGLADTSAVVSRVAKADITTSAFTLLQSTFPFLSTGFGLSQDGTKLEGANQGNFQILPNN